MSKAELINQKKNFENGHKLSFDLIAYRKMLLILYIPEHTFYQKKIYKMRNRGEGLFSISQLPITSLKVPSIRLESFVEL